MAKDELRWLILPATALVAGAALASLGLLVPPLHLLTHELTQALSLLGAVALLFTCRELVARGGRADRALASGLVAVVAAGVGVCAVHLPVDRLVQGCRVEHALIFFWVTWLPLGALAVTGGVATGGLSRRRLVLVLGGVLALCLAHDLGQLLLGRRVVDPLIGAPLFVDQRAGMYTDALQVLQRSWLALLAGVVLLPLRRVSEHRLPARVLATLFVLLTLGGGSRLGMGWGRGRIDAALDATHYTPHFTIHYGSDDETVLYIERIAREAEWQWRSVASDLGVGDEVVVDLFVYDNRRQLESLTGINAAHAWLRRVDLTWRSALEITLRHELVHALHWEVRPSPLIVLNRGLLEGTAMAWERGEVWDDVAHAQAAALLANGDLPPAPALMSPLGFYQVHESTAYAAAGSFVGWLVLTEGPERYWELNRTLDFESTYGRDLEALDHEWRGFLEAVPLDLEARRRARSYFDRRRKKAYVDEQCPKLGTLDWDPEELADEQLSRRDFAAAATVYEALLDERGAPWYAAQAARAWLGAGDTSHAQVLVDRGLTLPDLGEDERAELLRVALAVRLELDDVPEARSVLARLAELPDQDTEELDGLLRLFEDADLRLLVAELLAADKGYVRAAAARRLQAARPDDPDVQRLFIVHGLELPDHNAALGTTRQERDDLALALALAEGSPTACDALSTPLAGAGVALVRNRELELASQVADTLDRSCTRPFVGLSVRRLRERIEWERSLEATRSW